MQIKEITCKKCGASLDASALIENRNLVECKFCSSVFTLDKDLAKTMGGKEESIIIPMPKGIDVSIDNGFNIQYKWFSVKYLILIIFGAFWDVFIIVWFYIAISGGTWIMAAMGSFHAMVGIALTYWALAGIANKTCISITDVLEIKHGPIPWKKKRTIPCSEIVQFYCKKVVHYTKQGANLSYELHVILKNHKSIKLIGMMERPEQAIFLEKKIEKHLGIIDVTVADEYTG